MKNMIAYMLLNVALSEGIRAELVGQFLNKDTFKEALNTYQGHINGVRLPFLSSGPVIFFDESGHPYNFGQTKLIIQYLIKEQKVTESQLFQGLFSETEAIRCASSIGLQELYGLPKNFKGFQYQKFALSDSNWETVKFWQECCRQKLAKSLKK